MITLALPLLLALRARGASTLRHAHADQRGEGVISAAIAVLVMAFLGAAMWVTFDTMFSDTTQRTSDKVGEIGS
jgi:hypothetical protein